MLKKFLLCLSLTLASPAATQESPAIPSDIGERVTAGYAAPKLAAFADVTQHLHGRMEELCAKPSEQEFQDIRADFAEVVRAWGPVSILRFGPLIEENRFERIFFWPDARGVTLRQVQALLAEEDPQAITPEGLSEKSVAVQGLPALEFVLFGAGSETLETAADTYRCRYGAAIAANLALLAGEVETAWAPGTSFQDEFTEPAPENAFYRTPAEVAGEVVKALGTGLQFARNAELLPALGESVEKANGRRAPLWRSNLTFLLIGAQIEGSIGLLQAADFKTALDEGGGGVVDSVLFDLEHALRAIEEVENAAETAFAEEEDRGRLSYVTVALEGANHTIGEHLSAAIGLMMGFNALDGD